MEEKTIMGYAMIQTENSDAGEPTSLIDIQFFFRKENAVSTMEESFRNANAIMHWTDITEDDDHYIERSVYGIYVCSGMDYFRWEIREIRMEDEA